MVTTQSPLTGKPSSSPGVVTSWVVSSDFLTPGWMASYTLQGKCYQTPGLVHRGREVFFFFSLLLSGFEIVKLVCDVSVFPSEAPPVTSHRDFRDCSSTVAGNMTSPLPGRERSWEQKPGPVSHPVRVLLPTLSPSQTSGVLGRFSQLLPL